jgi:hypothetical protein
MKSLLIVSLQKSASTLLQEVCVDALDLTNMYEPFNPHYFQHIRDQEFLTWVNHKLPQYSKDPEEWEAMFALLMRRPEGCVFKDVHQVFFVKQFISQLRFNFHVIYLRRDLSEIVQCSERVGWDVSRLAQAQVESDRLFRPGEILTYDEFTTDFRFLQSMLLEYYQIKIKDYIDGKFKARRRKVNLFLGKN